MNWQPIETAPKDGRPVWVRGNNWGKPDAGTHTQWAFWEDGEWKEPGPGGALLKYLTHYLPTQEPPSA